MLQKESLVVTGASLRKGLVQAIPACVRLAPCAMSMSARGARRAHRFEKTFSRGISGAGEKMGGPAVLLAAKCAGQLRRPQ